MVDPCATLERIREVVRDCLDKEQLIGDLALDNHRLVECLEEVERLASLINAGPVAHA
jgi:hypothetical protein